MSDKKKVLFVDDEPVVRMLARRNLEMAGYEVYEAADGYLALEALRDPLKRPDLIATDFDYGTQGMNGVIFAREARRRGYDGPMTLAASGIKYIREDYPDADSLFVEYFDKPFKMAELVQVVRTHVPQPQ